MASRKIRDEIMMMTISVNSDPAQQAIYELRKENVEYAKTIDTLQKKKEELGRRNKANATEFDQLTKSIKENEKAISTNKDRMEDMRRSMDISKMTMTQLKKESELLKKQLGEVVPGSQSAKQYEQRLDAIRNRMSEVSIGSNRAANSFRNLADRFNHYSGIMTAVLAVFVGFGLSVQNIIDRNNKMADAMSGVEKNANMTRKEVEELTRSFSNLDTRTSKIDLMNIAIGGGRLGVAKKDIREFVEVADKAIVALGDSWKQTPDKIAESLGKVTTLYSGLRDLPIAESINMVGSALNELAADGAASEQNVNDFATRVGSLPEKLKPAIADALGLGAAFEESGIDAERSATAYSNFVKIASNNSDRFAKVMRLPVEQVKEMINTNPTEFFLKFSEGLKGMDATDLAKVLEYLKMNDQYITSIVGAASEKNERFRQTLDLSNKSLQEATSLTNEFSKVNNNAAGVYEKLQKKLAGMFTSEVVANTLNWLINAFSLFIGVNENAEKELGAFGKTSLTVSRVIGILVVSMFSINAAIAAYNLILKESVARQIALEAITKLRNITTGLGTALQQGWNLALGLGGKAVGSLTQMIGYNLGILRIQTAATNIQTAAQERLNLAMAKNPIGLIITLIGLAVTAYLSYKAVVGETEVAQRSLAEVQKEGVQNAAAEISELKLLVIQARDAKMGTDERRMAIEKLQQKFPSYFGQLDAEKAKNGELVASYEELRKAILASARAEAAKDELKKREAARLKRDQELQEEIAKEKRTRNDLKANAGGTTNVRLPGDEGKGFTVFLQNDDLLQASRDRLDNLKQEEINNAKSDEISDRIFTNAIFADEKRAALYNQDKNKRNTPTPDYAIPGSDDGKGSSKNTESTKLQREKELHEREMEDYKKRGEESEQLARQIQNDLENAEIEEMEDGFLKELDLINLQQKRREAELDKKKIGETEISALQKKIDTAKDEDKKLFQELMDSWLDNNKQLENLKTSEWAIFEAKRKAVYAKSSLESTKDEEKSYQDKLNKLTIALNNELAKYKSVEELKVALRGRLSKAEINRIKTWQDGKEALTKVYQKEELKLHVEHLNTMVSLYEGLDMSILSKEQQDQVLKFIEDAKIKLSEFKAVQNTNPNQSTEKSFGEQKAGNVDVLGMSTTDWENMFTNMEGWRDGLGRAAAAVGALQNAFSTYYSYVQAKEQQQIKEVDRNHKFKEERLKRMLSNGQINQEQYEAAVQRLNQETEMQKYKLEYDAAKRARKFQIGQTIANTAMAIMNIWATSGNPWIAAAMTAVVAALGVVQVSTIAKQPLPEAPGFEDGFGYGDNYNIRRQQDGKKFNVQRKKLKSGEVYRPTHFIAAENDRVEMVIANSDYKRFSPQLKHAINSEIAYSRGFQSGYYPYLEDNKIGGSTSAGTESSISADVIERNTIALEKVATMKPRAYIVKDMDLAKDVIDVTNEYNMYNNNAQS